MPARALAQDNPTGDPIVQKIYDEGMRRSQAPQLAQVLMDSIGPRLTGSPANRSRMTGCCGPTKRGESTPRTSSTARGATGRAARAVSSSFRRAMRVLEATMHAWSATTPSGGVTADVVIVPPAPRNRRQRRVRAVARRREGKAGAREHAAADLPSRLRHSILGRFGGLSSRRRAARQRAADWNARLVAAHVNARVLGPVLERAGAAGHSVQHVVARLGRGQDPVGARDAHTVVRRVVRGLHACSRASPSNGQHPRVHALAEATLAPE